MGSQVLQLLRQGVWAALTGGWYHDPEHSKFTNSCHLYLWLFLLLLPLALHLALPPSAFVVFLYCGSVTLLFAVIKLVSYRLHLMFDEGEAVRRRPSRKRERPSKHREASGEHTPSHKTPSHNQLAGSGKKGEWDRNSCTPPLGCGSPARNSSAHRSSGLPELPAQETAEDLKGVILAEDQPVVARAAPTPPGAPTDSSPPPKASAPGAGTPPPAGCPEPGVAGEDGRGQAGGGRGQPALRHRSEGGLEGPPRERPHLSASHSDLLDTGASFQRWGSENSVTKHDAQGPAGERPAPPSRSPRESLSRSWPQCHTGALQPGGHPPEDPSRRADPDLNLHGDVSEGDVAVTRVAASAPGDPRSPHEPIQIIITMSSARGSETDLESSLPLPGGGPPNLEQRIPVITLELPEDRGADQGAPEERWTAEAPSAQRAQGPGHTPRDAEAPGGERGRAGPASLDPSTCRSSQEKRHARVLSVDSGTEVLLSRGPAEGGQEKERAMPTSKSDLEAKEGQTPNESNFLEFVSLLESISTATVGAAGRRHGPAEPGREGRLPGDHGSQEKKSETVERGRHAKPGKPDAPSQEHASPSPPRTEPAKVTALFQGHRQRQIIYRVTSQQDSSVLQVISGPETSGQEEMSMDAMHVFIDGHGEIRSCYLRSGTQKDGPAQHQPPSHDGFSPAAAGDAPVSSSSSSSGSPDPSSGDAALSPLQQQLLLMVAQRTQPATPRHRSQDLEASSCSSAPRKFSRDQFYRFLVFPGKRVKVWYDRLALLALLDRTEDVRENVLAVSLVVLVSLLGFVTLSRGLCKDLWALLFCLVMAGCQYSLLKSVQPDPASPIHGHNRIIAYSRPIYFCVLCGLLLLLDTGAKARRPPTYVVYGLTLCSPGSLQSARDFLLGFLYCFPAISLLGLFPQIDTFCVYLLEQIDMLVFGGSAVSGMTSAVCSVARSAAAASALHALCFGAVKEPWSTQHIPALFSAFCGLLVSLCLHLSRQSSDPAVLLSFIRGRWFPRSSPGDPAEPAEDPLPGKMRDSVKAVLRSDLLLCSGAAVLSFAVSASTVFLSLRPFLGLALFAVAGAVGFVTHYLLPQLRKHHPWMWLAHPVLRGREHRQREVTEPAHVMWFERLYLRLQCVEKYALHPAIVLNALTLDAFAISNYRRLGTHWDIFLLIVAGMKLLRASFCHPGRQFAPLGLAVLFFHFDCRGLCDSFLLDFFLASVLCSKLGDLLQKLQFVMAYVAPWQMAWGSSFHVFAQLFAIPHSALLFAQTVATSVLSTPLSPFLGSVLFITSYVRPVKFWEKDYNTRRVDNSNTRLAVQMERDPASDDNNLNSIFYEHLTRSLQESLCGDLALGRWGNYGAGDCFILASDYLNAFVHLIEVANGLVTFQLRGLEFRGTYCQQREVEAIMEGAEEDGGCCCCRPGHLPHLLSCNAAFHLRWLTWEVARTRYVLEGYRVLDNNAATMLQVFDLRRALVRFYVQSIVYYLVTSPKLPAWLGSEALRAALQPFAKWHHIERDPGVFHAHIDEDFVPCLQGVTRASFCSVHLEWIQHCARRAQEGPQTLDSDEDSPLVTLAFALCILGRRALGTASHSMALSLDSFLHGLHALFKGDFRLAARDEWVFADMDLLQGVVAPAIRMALKLHQGPVHLPGRVRGPRGPVRGHPGLRADGGHLPRGRPGLAGRGAGQPGGAAHPAARGGRRGRRVQGHHAAPELPQLQGDQGEQGVRAGPVGRAAAGAHLPAEPQPGARQHPEPPAGAAQPHLLVLRPAAGLPHVRVPADHLLPGQPRPAARPLVRPRHAARHPGLAPHQVAQDAQGLPRRAACGRQHRGRGRSGGPVGRRRQRPGCGRPGAAGKRGDPPLVTPGGATEHRPEEGPEPVGPGPRGAEPAAPLSERLGPDPGEPPGRPPRVLLGPRPGRPAGGQRALPARLGRLPALAAAARRRRAPGRAGAGRGPGALQPGLLQQLHPQLPVRQEELFQRPGHLRALGRRGRHHQRHPVLQQRQPGARPLGPGRRPGPEALLGPVRPRRGRRAGPAPRAPGRGPRRALPEGQPGGHGPGRHGLPAQRLGRAVGETGPPQPRLPFAPCCSPKAKGSRQSPTEPSRGRGRAGVEAHWISGYWTDSRTMDRTRGPGLPSRHLPHGGNEAQRSRIWI